jgi:predicted transcriptional regulator
MAQRADSAALNVQPRQRRQVYEYLARVPAGRSVKELLRDGDIPERDLREALRKLDSAGLARRVKGTWSAVPLETADHGSTTEHEMNAGGIVAT